MFFGLFDKPTPSEPGVPAPLNLRTGCAVEC